MSLEGGPSRTPGEYHFLFSFWLVLLVEFHPRLFVFPCLKQMPTARLHFEAGSPRYYLDGEPLHAGDSVELQLACGTWTAGRYEYVWQPSTRELDAYVLTAEQRFAIDMVNLRLPGTN